MSLDLLDVLTLAPPFILVPTPAPVPVPVIGGIGGGGASSTAGRPYRRYPVEERLANRKKDVAIALAILLLD